MSYHHTYVRAAIRVLLKADKLTSMTTTTIMAEIEELKQQLRQGDDASDRSKVKAKMRTSLALQDQLSQDFCRGRGGGGGGRG